MEKNKKCGFINPPNYQSKFYFTLVFLFWYNYNFL